MHNVDNRAIIYIMIDRFLTNKIRKSLGKGKVVILYGPRRVGKTTVAKQLLAEVDESSGLYLNCDELAVQESLESRNLSVLENMIGAAKRVVIDEAQRVKDIGIVLKLLIDARPELDIIATGSSSFELAGRVKEPLTGRSFEFVLHPLSLAEIQRYSKLSPLDIPQMYERLLRFGAYPSVFLAKDDVVAEELSSIAKKYVFKDTLELVDLRQRQLLPRLLTALALQVGQEVSYNELANKLGVKLETIERYITILEHAFIIYRLQALTNNKRNQISNRKRKVYFFDLGVRNALIENTNPLSIRDDVGALWENFCINERQKQNVQNNYLASSYYWRGLYGEVDLVEITATQNDAFEFKWSVKNVAAPKAFKSTYPESSFSLIHRDNALSWLLN